MEFEFKLVNEDWKKKIWNKRFRNAYRGKLIAYGRRTKRQMLSENNKYITIGVDGVEYGFARIQNMSSFATLSYSREVWCIEELFIRPQFRHQGCARALICHLRENYYAYVIYMQKRRALKLIDFHTEIGFSVICDHPLYLDMVDVCFDPTFAVRPNIASNDNEIRTSLMAA